MVAQPVSQPRAAVYCRVSSEAQEDGASLDEQERICREYAARHGLAVVDVFREVYDGEEIERPVLRLLLNAAKRGEADTVIVWKQDRLGRGIKAHEVVYYMCELAGLEPACVLEPYGDSSELTMTRGMRGIVSGEEKKNIRLRTQGGRKARASAGKIIPGPRPLYGYEWKDAGHGKGQTKVAYVVNDDEAAIVRHIYRELAGGKGLKTLALEMTAAGIPTPNGGPHWNSTTIRKIAREPRYTGRAYAYGPRKVVRVKGPHGGKVWREFARPEAEIVALPDGTIPPIVGEAEAALVGEQLARNQREAVRNSREPERFLLRAGHIRCGACGRAAHTMLKAGHTSRAVYVVQRYEWRHKDCPHTTTGAATLDAQVWEDLKE